MADLAHSQPAAQASRGGNPLTRGFGNLSVRIKILAAVGVVALMASAIGLVAIQKLGSVDSNANAIYQQGMLPVTGLTLIRQEVMQMRMDTAMQAISQTDEDMNRFEAAVKADDATTDKSLAAYKPLAEDPKAFAAIVTEIDKYRAVRDAKLIPLGRANKSAEWSEVRDTVTAPIFLKLFTDIQTQVDNGKAHALVLKKQAHATYTAARTLVLVLLVGGVALAVFLAMLVARAIVSPLKKVSAALKAMAGGDLTQHADVSTTDELGVMAGEVNGATDSLRSTVQAMAGSAQALAAAAEQLTATSNSIASSAEETSAQAGVVASAAEQVSTNVQTVAAGTEQMGASIREIAQNAADAAGVAAQAVTVAASTNDTISKLGESSQEIGNVIKVITSIAEQTNLLALNATIEAARAGEAGKGFAVVANEVKDLAQETARATEDISRRVVAIQTDTGGAVKAIAEISQVIAQINAYTTTIAAAVEEQTATTNEISRNVTEAATGSQEIAANVVGVATAAQLTTTGVAESQQAANDLARMSAELQTLVGKFTY